MIPKNCRLLVIMVVVTGCLVPPPTPTLAHQIEEPIHFTQIQMFSPLEGWGFGTLDNIDEILRTDDGGVTWRWVYRPFEIYPYEFAAFFLDMNHAWLMESSETPAVWYTDDGGQMWIKATLPGGSLLGRSGIMQFIDSQMGWLLALDCCAAGNEFAKMFQTTDGGQHWQLINDTDREGGLNTAYHTGMEFQDADNGWMTEASIGGYGGLLKTNDGGVTWAGVELPTPATEEMLQGCDMQQPTVFSADVMTLVVNCIMRQFPTTYLYATDDGGQTWAIHPVATAEGDYSTRVVMLDSSVGWFVHDHEDRTQSLYQTSDGGQTWQERSVLPQNLWDIGVALDFIDAKVGWAVASSGDLLHTTDGGGTWTVLDAHVLLPAS